MTNTIIQQFHFGGNPVRTVVLDSEPWFVAKDVCDVLGLATNHVRRTLDSDEIANLPNREVGNWKANISNSGVGNPGHTGGRDPLIVSESGLYTLILKGREPEVKDFRRWVTHEVIPHIRRTGGYIPQGETPEETMARAVLIAQKTIQEQQRQLEEQKPKALFAQAVESSKRSILIGELAKMLRQNGVNVGQNRLFAWMRGHGYLTAHNIPTQRSMDLKVMEVKETVITHASGFTTTNITPKITGKGQVYFLNKFLANQPMEVSR